MSKSYTANMNNITANRDVLSIIYNTGGWGQDGSLSFNIQTKFGIVGYEGIIYRTGYKEHIFMSIRNNRGSVIRFMERELESHNPGGMNMTLNNIVNIILDCVEQKFKVWPYVEDSIDDFIMFRTDMDGLIDEGILHGVERCTEIIRKCRRDARRNLIRIIHTVENTYDKNPNAIDML